MMTNGTWNPGFDPGTGKKKKKTLEKLVKSKLNLHFDK